MKNILLGSIFMLVFLPQVSFGQNQAFTGQRNPELSRDFTQVDCNHLDDRSVAFFAFQAQERGDFMKANPDSVARHDQHFRGMLALDMARRTGKPTAGLSAPPDEDTSFAAFQQKQQNDKNIFFQKLNQRRQACSNPQPAVTNTPATTPAT